MCCRWSFARAICVFDSINRAIPLTRSRISISRILTDNNFNAPHLLRDVLHTRPFRSRSGDSIAAATPRWYRIPNETPDALAGAVACLGTRYFSLIRVYTRSRANTLPCRSARRLVCATGKVDTRDPRTLRER